MLYAQIKPNRDNVNVWKTVNNHYKLSVTLIADELFTMNEINKLHIPDDCYDIVNYPKNKSYKVFGIRFNSAQNRF